MPSVQWGATTTAKLVFVASAALKNLPNGAGTIAILWKPLLTASGSDGAGLTDNGAPGAWYHAHGITTSKWYDDDGVATIVNTTAPTAGNWHVSVVTWPAGAAALERFHWQDITAAGAWTHENSTGNNSGNRAGPATGWFRVGAYNDANMTSGTQIALVGAWAGTQLSDAQCAALTANKRTSDWYNSAAGPPTLLSEITTLTPTDIGTNPSAFSSANSTTTGLTVGGDPAGGWLFDGIGGAVARTTRVWVPQRGIRDRIAMRRYAQTPPSLLPAGVTFTDVMAGALIFGGTVEESWAWRFPNQRHPRRLPIARGLRDPEGLRGYTRKPSALRFTYADIATGAWIFGSSAVEAKRGTDAGSGSVIFGGTRVEAKRGTDARSGALIFGGTRTEATTFVQTASGALIFGGTRTELKRGTDARSGSVIFGGSRTELKRYGDVRSGTLIFGGSATQLRIGTDARTGAVIFGGHSSTVTASGARAKVTFIIPDARGRRRRTRW